MLILATAHTSSCDESVFTLGTEDDFATFPSHRRPQNLPLVRIYPPMDTDLLPSRALLRETYWHLGKNWSWRFDGFTHFQRSWIRRSGLVMPSVCLFVCMQTVLAPDDLGIDGRKLLTWVREKYDCRVSTGFTWPTMGSIRDLPLTR
jgi:hypothetical protein